MKGNRDVAQLGSALASGARGRRFKSCHSDHDINCLFIKAVFLLTSLKTYQTTPVYILPLLTAVIFTYEKAWRLYVVFHAFFLLTV